MSGELKPIFTWRSAIAQSDLPSAARLVGYALSLHMNEMGGSAFPGPALLAKETGLHPSTVKQKLAELERLGWIECVERGGIKGEKRRANVYSGRVPDPALPGVQGDPSSSATRRSELDDPSSSVKAPGVQDDPSSSYNSSENLEEPDQKLDGRVEPTDAGRAHLALIQDQVRPGRRPRAS